MSLAGGRQRRRSGERAGKTPLRSPMASRVAHTRTEFVPMLTTAAPVGVGSRRSERRAARVTGLSGGVGVGGSGVLVRTRQGANVQKRSWGWRLVAIAAGVALALGLVACGGDDDTAADTATAGGGGTTLNLAYVTTAAHPYGIAVEGFAKEVNADGQVTIKTQASYPQAESQLLADAPKRRRRHGDDLERGLGQRRPRDLRGAAGALPHHQLRPRGRGHRRRHRQVDDRRRSTAARATSWCSPSTRVGCASRSASSRL